MTRRGSGRRFRASVAGHCLVLCAALALGAAPAAPAGEVDRVIASVDGEPITMFDLKTFSAANGVALPDPSSPQSQELLRAALKGLITQKMMEEELKKYEGEVEEKSVDQYIDSIEQHNHLSDAAFRAQLAQSGVSYEQFRKQAHTELEKMTMIDREVRQKIEISPDQIKRYYDAHHDEFMVAKERLRLAQILVAVDSGAPPADIQAARRKAEALRARALKGEDFAELAKANSDDESKSNGGELGDFAPGEIMDQIKQAVANLKPGQISEVVQSSFGFHILKLEEHDKPGLKPLGEVRGEIHEKLLAAETQEHFKHWLDSELIKSHHVESFF